MKKLEGKVALVTGSSKGIGAEIAQSLASCGAKVVVNYFSDKEGADRVVKTITDNGGDAIAIQADVTKATDVKRLFDVTIEKYSKIDLIVNNAGVYAFGPVELVTEEGYYNQFDRNVLGVILTIQEGLKHFEVNKGGNIINISSVASVMPTPMSMIYSASKCAVDGITKSLSKELAPKNIRINSILPGPTETEGNPIIGSEMEGYVVSQTPMGRIGQPTDIAGLAVFLASDDAAWITGQKIVVSGGFE